MKTFYSDLHVALTKCAVNTPPPSVTSPSSEKRKINREKSVTIAVSVLGSSRASGAKAEWDVFVAFYLPIPLTQVEIGLTERHD
jgi:hypothetical protein